MGYERYPRGTNPQGDYYNRSETQDYGQDYGSGREGSYSNARDFEAAGEIGPRGQGRYGGWRERDEGRSHAGQSYGQRDSGYYQGDRGQAASYAGSYGSDGRRFENCHDRDRSADQGRQDRQR